MAEDEDASEPRIQAVIFLKVIGLAVLVERSMNPSLCGPFVVTHEDSILDVSPQAAALGISRSLQLAMLASSHPQVHVVKPPFARGIHGIRDRYKERADLVLTFLSGCCGRFLQRDQEGGRGSRILPSLDCVDWDEYFLDVQFTCDTSTGHGHHDGGAGDAGEEEDEEEEEEEEAAVMEAASELGRHIRAGLRNVLGCSLVLGIGWTRHEAQEDATQSHGRQEEEELRALLELQASPEKRGGPLEATTGGEVDEENGGGGGWGTTGPTRQGAETTVLSGEGGSNSGGVAEADNRRVAFAEDDDEDLDYGGDDDDGDDAAAMVVEEDGGEEQPGPKEMMVVGYVCEKCKAYFDTEEALQMHCEEARTRDGKRKRRSRQGEGEEGTSTSVAAVEGHDKPHDKKQHHHHAPMRSQPQGIGRVPDLRHDEVRPTRLPPPPAEAAADGASRGPVQLDSFTALLGALDDEADIRGYLKSRGAPVVTLPGWSLTPVDLTEEEEEEEEEGEGPTPHPAATLLGTVQEGPPSSSSPRRGQDEELRVAGVEEEEGHHQRPHADGQARPMHAAEALGRADGSARVGGGRAVGEQQDDPLLLSNSSDQWEETRLVIPTRAHKKKRAFPQARSIQEREGINDKIK